MYTRSVLLCFCALLLACAPLTKLTRVTDVVMCAPMQENALRLAADIMAHDVELPPNPSDPIESEDWCYREIKELGYMVVEKPWAGHDHFSTTIPLPEYPDLEVLPDGALAVVKGFWDMPVEDRAAIMCHELVHARGQSRKSLAAAAKEYFRPSGRIAWEAGAYWVTLKIKEAQGRNVASLRNSARKTTRGIHKNYLIAPFMGRACLEDTLAKTWAGESWSNG